MRSAKPEVKHHSDWQFTCGNEALLVLGGGLVAFTDLLQHSSRHNLKVWEKGGGLCRVRSVLNLVRLLAEDLAGVC